MHGMIAIPALHDAANDSPIRYTPVCSHTAIPVCLNPAYTGYLPVVAAALEPVLSEVAGLPGALVRITQSAATYQQGPGNDVGVGMAGPSMSGRPPVFHLLLPEQLGGPPMTTSELAAEVRSKAGQDIVADVIGAGPGASPAQQAVMAALLKAAAVPQSASSVPQSASSAPRTRPPSTAPQLPAPVHAAAQRFAALPAAIRHAWLTRHLAALRAGRISLAQLP
jgi:hypothetical protein